MVTVTTRKERHEVGQAAKMRNTSYLFDFMTGDYSRSGPCDRGLSYGRPPCRIQIVQSSHGTVPKVVFDYYEVTGVSRHTDGILRGVYTRPRISDGSSESGGMLDLTKTRRSRCSRRIGRVRQERAPVLDPLFAGSCTNLCTGS